MTSQRQFRVLVAVGPDRPGLVHGISALIHEAGANLEDSRMAVLGGEFAIVLLYSGTETELAAVDQRRGETARRLGLEIFAKQTTRPPEAREETRVRVRVSGLDRPGIVDTVTRVFARRDVNVQTLETGLSHQPLTGTVQFTLDARLTLPAGVTLAELRQELSAVCEEEQLELTVDGG